MQVTATGDGHGGEPAASFAETASTASSRVLVAYASQHGATRGIAGRIAETLRAAGLAVDVQSVDAADPAGYDACVIGSAAYFGSWLKEATAFVRRHRAVLASRPVWLFSSGPIGCETVDAEGRDVLALSVPQEIPELESAVHPRGHRVFFGRVELRQHGFLGRLAASLPASWMAGVEGDFRDWAAIETWAAGIAGDLALAPAGRR